MGLPVYSLIPLPEFKSFVPIEGIGKDAELERAIARASRRIEEHTDRRLIFRAPPEVAGAANIVAEVALADGALTVIAPNAAGRTLIVTITMDSDRSISGGLVTVTGTVAGTAGTTEVFDLTAGTVLHGVKFFTAISGIVVSALSGANSTIDKIKVGSSEGYVEFHNSPGWSELIPIEWALRQVQEVNEDLNGVFGATTALVAGTSYEVRQGHSIKRRIARISNRSDFPFYSGRRVVKLRYSAGYFTSLNVPEDIKGVAKRLATAFYQEADKGQIETASGSNALGSWSRFGPAELTDADRRALAPYERAEFERTGERDWDLDAA